MGNPPVRLLIHGASGRMGRALVRLAAQDPRLLVVAAVSRFGTPIEGVPVPFFAASTLAGCPQFDVAVDFSLPEGFDRLLAECRRRRAALVSGTTGLTEPQRSLLAEAAGEIPVLWASNFSLGVAVLEDLVRRASRVLGQWPVEIVETHHVHKKDAPSGTALSLGKAVQETSGLIPDIASLREGEVVGDHLLRFHGPGETLELAHRAQDRDIFARGALEACARIAGAAPGSRRLADLLFDDK